MHGCCAVVEYGDRKRQHQVGRLGRSESCGERGVMAIPMVGQRRRESSCAQGAKQETVSPQPIHLVLL
jgi:hypothetical protein